MRYRYIELSLRDSLTPNQQIPVELVSTGYDVKNGTFRVSWRPSLPLNEGRNYLASLNWTRKDGGSFFVWKSTWSFKTLRTKNDLNFSTFIDKVELSNKEKQNFEEVVKSYSGIRVTWSGKIKICNGNMYQIMINRSLVYLATFFVEDSLDKPPRIDEGMVVELAGTIYGIQPKNAIWELNVMLRDAEIVRIRMP